MVEGEEEKRKLSNAGGLGRGFNSCTPAVYLVSKHIVKGLFKA